MKSSASRVLFAAVAMMLVSACSKNGGFETQIPSTNTPGNNSGQSTNPGDGFTTPQPTPPSAFDKLDLNSYVNGTSYDTERVFAIDKANKALLLFLPLPPGPFSNVYIDAPNVKGLKISTALDSKQKARIAVSIPLTYVVKNKITTLPNSSTLPGGRSLPMMPSGEYPSLGLGLNQQSENKVYLYIGVNAVGMFVESSYFPEYMGITAPVKNQGGTRTLGSFTIVPKQGVNNGGLFLSFILPKDIAKIIDDHLSGIIQ